MDSDTSLDYALFQLSPRRSHCELFVSSNGKTEKLASGLLKPFVTHLKVAEEQVAQAVQSISLQVKTHKNAGTWFSKGTLERFVRFVSTPEVLELVNTFDAEMSQLEGARIIYSQGVRDQLPGRSGDNETATATGTDATKKELVRAIDVRLVAVKQDLTMAFARASAAGFTLDSVSELLLFADHFGALRLHEACSKFISLCQRRPELISPQPALPPWKEPAVLDDLAVRSSSGSDMSIDDPDESADNGAHVNPPGGDHHSLAVNPVASQPPPSEQQWQDQAHTGGPATSQQPKPTTFRRLDRGSEGEKAAPAKQEQSTFAQPASGSRRLSVQDRINLFENKQKEQTSSNSSAGSGNKVGGKAELRRLSSDLSSSVEKSVLRRWSGASDMSIELNNSSSNRKAAESVFSTPSSSLDSQAQTSSRNEDKDTAASLPRSGTKDEPAPVVSSSSSSSFQVQLKEFPRDKDQNEDIRLRGQTATETLPLCISGSDQADSLTQVGASSGRELSIGLESQAAPPTQIEVSFGAPGNIEVKDLETSQSKFIAVFGAENQAALKENEVSHTQQDSVLPRKAHQTGSRQAETTKPSRASLIRGVPSGVDDDGLKDEQVSLTHFRASLSKNKNSGSIKKASSDSRVLLKALSGKAGSGGTRSEQIAPQSQQKQKTLSTEAEQIKMTESTNQSQLNAFPSKVEGEVSGALHSDIQGMKLHRQASAPEKLKTFHGMKNERTPSEGNLPVFWGRKAKDNIEDPTSTSSLAPVQMSRPSKGNQELNDELQMKADELEKLFAAHKLRVHGDQTASSRRDKPADLPADHMLKAVQKKPVEVLPDSLPKKVPVREGLNRGGEFDANFLLKMVDNQGYGNKSKQKLDDFSPSEDFRGNFYERYMQKRDVKLRDEWGTKRLQKEAKMKAMQDSLEHSSAEMKAKFAGSSDRQDSVRYAQRRAERVRSFSDRAMMRKEQPVEYFLSEEEEDTQDLSEQTPYGQDICSNETLSGDGSSRSIYHMKLVSSMSVSSSTPRSSAAPIPRPSVKTIYSGSATRRTQQENPLVQSVPNFSDLRKENTKPFSGVSKIATRLHSRNYARSKSTSEEINLVKEEKPQRSQSMRKSSAKPGELKDLSPLKSDHDILTPLRYSKVQTEQSIYNKIYENGNSKPLLRKGHGISPGAEAGITQLNLSLHSENQKNEENSEEWVDEQEDSHFVREEVEEFEGTLAEEASRSVYFPVDSENEKPRLSQESGNSGNPESESSEVLRTISQGPDDSAGALAAISSKFNTTIGNTQESPGESPGSWNSRAHHSFAYAQEASDVDASIDSPIGSPASWNSHPLNQMMEVDAARMRKKWGSAQKPILVANASHHSRKDVTKGFKRLLKFGRKSKGAESLINDWVSASTTSEGDDDTEDGRDLANRSFDDLPKSRMGFSHYHSTYDSFNEGEIFQEQDQSLHTPIPAPPVNLKLREDHLSGSSLKAPRSFFSLSSFRSKGSESKLR